MVTLLAVGLMQSQASAEAAWQEARNLCKDRRYVSYSISGGGFGWVNETNAILAADGRYVFSIRGERPARDFGGSGRFPMVVVENSVHVFDGSRYRRYDGLTGSLETVNNPATLRLKNAYETFWLDRRNGMRLASYEEVASGVLEVGNYRRFRLILASGEYDWDIYVRMRDGLVLAERSVPKIPEPLTEGSGGQGGLLFAAGHYLDREPTELNWKPPTQRNNGGVSAKY